MFDPTIYDNIKVVLEGEIYDLDLSGVITVTNRRDLVNLAVMSREFTIQFEINGKRDKLAEIRLEAKTEDLSREILEEDSKNKPGCELTIVLFTKITNPEEYCKEIEEKVNKIWDFRTKITQKISYIYIQERKEKRYLNEVYLSFGRKIDEDNIDDIRELIELTIKSLEMI